MSTSQQAVGTAKDEAGQTAGTARDEAVQTAQTAKDQAADVGQHAAAAASDVAGTAKEQVGAVAGQALDQVKDLGSQVRGQLSEQAGTAAQKLSEVLRSLAEELGHMTQHDGAHGAATQAARQLSEQGHRLADYLEGRDPDTLLSDLRGSAARRPGRFLLGAVIAGVVTGRIVRSTRDASSDDSPAVASAPSYPTLPATADTAVLPDTAGLPNTAGLTNGTGLTDGAVLPVPTAVGVSPAAPIAGSWEAERPVLDPPPVTVAGGPAGSYVPFEQPR